MNLQRTILALAVSLAALAVPAMAQQHETPMPAKQKWSFSGPFGKYDQGQLQRGFKVYREVCLTCHGMELLSFRNLAEPGGPGFSAAQAAAVAAEYKIAAGVDDQGQPIERARTLADRFPPPLTKFPGVTPPDMSVIAKARGYERGFPRWVGDMFTQYQEHGVDYIVALLTGYTNAPQGVELPPATFYNSYFPGHAIAMPPPLTEGRVEYTDGTPTTVEQYSKDVSAFLMWAAEPHLEARKRIGFQVFIFLVVFAGLLYFTKKKVWREVDHSEGHKSPSPTA
jgi:ubiquinol-cytochrome c reductase cytochrome b/c1 subunit